MNANRSVVVSRLVMQWFVIMLAGWLMLGTALAETRTWDGTTGNWLDAGRWSGGTVPQAGETAVVNDGSILLDSPTADLAAFTMNGGTLTFTNWTTALRATNVTVSGGTMTLPPAFTDVEMSNRVYVVCSNFTLGASAVIDVDAKGFLASQEWRSPDNVAYGPGAPGPSAHYGAGAGYGGIGGFGSSGSTPGGPIYGRTNAPTQPGSGGGGNSLTGHGGGSVRIDAVGTVTIDGTVTAKGGSPSHGGGGSGGGIFISCARFEGAESGLLLAEGGDRNVTGSTSKGGTGGGGRIAVAIGVSAADVQSLIDGDPVANVFTSERCGKYRGNYSVANGAPLATWHPWPTGDHHEGEPGTFRFVTTSSDSEFWLYVRGDPDDHGNPLPYGHGINTSLADGTQITNSIQAFVDDGDGIGWNFLGWSVTNQAGALVAEGTSTQTVFTLSTNVVLTYQWTNMYQLSVTSAVPVQGSVNSGTGEGWYTNGVAVSGISATPASGYEFNRWTGIGVPAGQETSNPLATTMIEPRLLAANFSKIGGETKTWNGDGDWDEPGQWTPDGIPGWADDAVIASGTVTVPEPHVTGSLTVNSGASMIFTNWNAKLTAAGTITVDGTVTTPPHFTEAAMSNRVYLVCREFVLSDGGHIDVAAKGFSASPHITIPSGEGPGKGFANGHFGGGGGHGGGGGSGTSGVGGGTYGVTNMPTAPGSGGGGNGGGGNGGGAVFIDVSRKVTIDGTINASGGNGSAQCGGGSGGSIFIACQAFQGAASGVLRADGGNGAHTSSGAGGGGRIAVAIGLTAAQLEYLIANGRAGSLTVSETHPNYAGVFSAGGSLVPADRSGEDGTKRFLFAPPRGSLIMLR